MANMKSLNMTIAGKTLSDKFTVQTYQTSNYDVGVFNVNNYRAWELSIGYGQHGGDHYIPVELQRNFSMDAAVSVEYHYGGVHEKGFEVKYTRKTDKLFGLF